MLPRLKLHNLALFFVLCMSVLGMAAAPAAAAPQPWWQIVTGSRPTHLWEPENNVQELKAGPEVTVLALEGVPVACMYSPFCPFLGFANVETAQQLQEALEAPGAYGPGNVEVVEEPESSRRFLITSVGEDAGRPVPPLSIFIGTGSSVKTLQAGGSGYLVVTITNLGNADLDASSTPVEIVDDLPEGVEVVGDIEATAGAKDDSGPLNCEPKTPHQVACTFEGTLPPFEAFEVEIPVSLDGDPPAAGAPGKVTVSGGNADPLSVAQEIKVSPEPTPFGLEHFSAQLEEEGGAPGIQPGIPDLKAGKHPFQLTTTIQFNAGRRSPGTRDAFGTLDVLVEQPALPRNLRFPLPAGMVGNASIMDQCAMNVFLITNDNFYNDCPDSSVVGVASVTVIEPVNLGLVRVAVPVFNLPPAYGEPARFGIMALGTPVVIDTAVDPDNQYRIIASVRNTPQVAYLLSSSVAFWGTPGDSSHDSTRGWNCVYFLAAGPCQRPSGLEDKAFLHQPTSCANPLDFHAEIEPWNAPLGSAITKAESILPPMVGCNQVPFDPTVGASPTSKLASNPSGFEFRLTMPNAGLLDKDSTAETQAKKVEVTLPEGMTINPSQGEGLVGCSPAELARETSNSLPGEGCPNASKVGEVQVSTPLLEEEAHGSLFVASPHDNPFDSLLALYMVAKIPERGILIKQAGVVRPDPVTGRLVTTFDNLPQQPFTSFKLRFKPGGRAPLVTPPACGDYDVVARFTPWSAADPNNPTAKEIVTRTTSFEIERGADGGDCPGGGLSPFHPALEAGTINNSAGSYSPFNLRLTRNDSEQEFTNLSIKLPPGVIGKLAGIDVCSDAAIAAAKARTGPNGGLEELQNPSCPTSSQVGRTLVGAGVGASLTYVPGKIYLAGPFNGAPLSVVSITAARVGPFDLGTVVLRLALRIDPETAEVFVDATRSDPIPHIIQGIPVHARDIRAYVDRTDFVLNPTNCEPTSTASTVLGSGLDFGSAGDDEPVTVTSPFQAADCASLGFKPKLSLHLIGGTKRADFPKLRAVLQARPGDANLGKIQVTLPHSEFIEQGHFKTICTRVQFAAGGVPGEGCPKNSIYGHARVFTPLLDNPIEGPVFLRSSNHPLPDLVMALHNDQINLNVDGRVDSVNGRLRSTFELLPDAPVTKAVLNMRGGKKGLFVNSTNLCKGKHNALVKFDGQNGKLRDFKTPLKAQCGKKGKKRKASR